ncbi:hypothetical protein J437_LFUL001799 [Ladona fulva]|uniref:Uncharacterized protein n=1 Tax=Ladona fulva TaxID=123851 RepID=A0A8K0NTI2_LADFU|nr:hypothetical protein J437_LFUL001799 [Ladona fulva]
MSRLFNVFVKQVEGYCGDSSMPVWDSMMKGGFEVPDEKRPQDFYVTNPSTGSNLLREVDDRVESPKDGEKGSSASASDQFTEYASPPGGISYRPLGPMMFRVMPDGAPVPGDGPQHFPKDEDAEEYALLRSRFVLPPHDGPKKGRSSSESEEKNLKSEESSEIDNLGQYQYTLVK